MHASLKRALEASKSLPSIPAIAIRILDLARQDSGLSDLVPALSRDPALAAKLIRYANSPAYSRAERIGSIKPAVMQLGLTTTVMVSLSFSLVGALRPASDGSLNYEGFWRRSLVAAAAARFAARAFGVPRMEEAFLAALLQDIGMLALDRAGLGIYEGLGHRQADHTMLRVLERGRAKASHAEVGAWLLDTWTFPPVIAAAVATSHDLETLTRSATEPTLAWCVAYSGVLADAMLDSNPADFTEALAWADPFAPASGLWHELVLEHLSQEVLDVEHLFDASPCTNLPELMNASKALLADRSLSLTARFR